MRVLMVSPVSLQLPRGGDAVRVHALAQEFSRYSDVALMAPAVDRHLPIQSRSLQTMPSISRKRNSDLVTAIRAALLGMPYDSARFVFDGISRVRPGAAFDVAFLNLVLGWDLWLAVATKMRAKTLVSDLQNDDPSMWQQRAARERRFLIRVASKSFASRAAVKIKRI